MITLRPYQEEALSSLNNHLAEKSTNPCIVLPTGSGKTPLLARICMDQISMPGNRRVIVISHVKELVEQSYRHLIQLAGPDLSNEIGLYSASLGQRETEQRIIVAQIQSVYRRAYDLGQFDLIIIDEAHLIPEEGEGMYRTFLQESRVINPDIRVIGLTATPYRMSSGEICKPENILNEVCYEINVRDLIDQGFLCPLKSKGSAEKIETESLHVRGGEFIAAEVEDLYSNEGLIQRCCSEIKRLTAERNSVLIFCPGVFHARTISDTLGEKARLITGETPLNERDEFVNEFKDLRIKYLVNVSVLTTGFDAPNIDCIVLLRPTMSPVLYQQMVGRGLRISPGKSDCLILDYGKNILRHGPIDDIRLKSRKPGSGEGPGNPYKQCPQCQSIIGNSCRTCPDCSYQFPIDLETQASVQSAISKSEIYDIDVLGVAYYEHTKKGSIGGPKTLRVEYEIGQADYLRAGGSCIREWVCPEHTGYARSKFEQWWLRRDPRNSFVYPNTVREALSIKNSLKCPSSITIKFERGERYPKIIAYEFKIQKTATEVFSGDYIPF